MKVIAQENNFWLLKFSIGEEALSGLKEFFSNQNLKGAVFEAIGALQKVELGFYDLQKQEYIRCVFEEGLEIAPLIGNISRMGDEIIVHAHGAFSRRDSSAIAGHVFSLTVGGTVEVHLRALQTELERDKDEETGLNLLK